MADESQLIDHHKTWRIPVIIFLIGFLFSLIMFATPAGSRFFLGIAQGGFFGLLFAGILYAFSFTSTSATIIFAELPASVHPVFAAIIGAVGALIYDAIIFSLTRYESHQPWYQKIDGMIHPKHRTPKWLLTTVGGIILASPLPDELAAGILGVSGISPRRFLILSFLLNAAGIFVISTLGGL